MFTDRVKKLKKLLKFPSHNTADYYSDSYILRSRKGYLNAHLIWYPFYLRFRDPAPLPGEEPRPFTTMYRFKFVVMNKYYRRQYEYDVLF